MPSAISTGVSGDLSIHGRVRVDVHDISHTSAADISVAESMTVERAKLFNTVFHVMSTSQGVNSNVSADAFNCPLSTQALNVTDVTYSKP